MRTRLAEMGGKMPLLRCLEFIQATPRLTLLRRQRCPRRHQPARHLHRQAAATSSHPAGTAHRHRRHRTQPRIGRRHRARQPHPAGRRTRHRQVHPHPTNRHAPAPAHSLRQRRRKRTPAETSSRPPGCRIRHIARRQPPRTLRNLARKHLPTNTGKPPPVGHHRLHSNHRKQRSRIAARQHVASKSLRRFTLALLENVGHPHPTHRPHHQGRHAGRSESAGTHRRHRTTV